MSNRKVKIVNVNYSYNGYLLAWSTNYEELREGIGHGPCAIIEKDDGTVCVEWAQSVRFSDWKMEV